MVTVNNGSNIEASSSVVPSRKLDDVESLYCSDDVTLRATPKHIFGGISAVSHPKEKTGDVFNAAEEAVAEVIFFNGKRNDNGTLTDVPDTTNETKSSSKEHISFICKSNTQAKIKIMPLPAVVTPIVSLGAAMGGSSIKEAKQTDSCEMPSVISIDSGKTKKLSPIKLATIFMKESPPTPINLGIELTRIKSKQKKFAIRTEKNINEIRSQLTTETTVSTIIQEQLGYFRDHIERIARIGDQFIAIFCSVVTFILHSCIIFKGEFVWDDRAAVLGNPDVLGHQSLWHLLKRDFWGQEMSLDKSHKSFRPLAVLSLRMSYAVYGQDGAYGFHFDNVFLHALITYMYSTFCFQLVNFQVKERKLLGRNSAMIASILFSVHPIHTEPVASIVGKC